eukprot:TRINITY_DN6799_c0_g1_i1.p1 TRINITY_DN6799_c0_g1~~TRINITY_DN6799_c0_g1_i1.p1  ORF type:complete len:130 (-),score=11.16 TRINITY_DN6799_c0_g1_i1:249-638(-)
MHPEKKASMATAMVPPERQVEMTAVLHLRMDLHMQSTVDRHHLDLVRRLLVLYSSLRLRLLVAAMEKSQQTCRSEFMMVTEVSKVFKFVLLESSPTQFTTVDSCACGCFPHFFRDRCDLHGSCVALPTV